MELFFTPYISLVSIVCLATAIIAGVIAITAGLWPQRRTGRESAYEEPDFTDDVPTDYHSFQPADNITTFNLEKDFHSNDEAGRGAVEDSEESTAEGNTESPRNPAAEPAPEPQRELPMASVIAFTPEDSGLLDDFIQAVSAQDYPRFEIILVLDAGMETRDMLVEKYSRVPNLYLTFIPPGSQNLSRRKLAITLGMKAARGDVAVLTSSVCHIPSDRWLGEMMIPFIKEESTDVALGFCRPDSFGAKGLKGIYRCWYWANTSMQWIGYALRGKPYRGDGLNLAFRRSVFFDHKGYAGSINLHSGDDDLFVNEITDSDNTRVVLSPATILTVLWGESASKMWTDRRERHDFTSRWLPRGPFLRAGLLSWSQWLLFGGCVAGAVASLPEFFAAIAAVVILTGFFIAETIIWSHGYRVIAPARTFRSTPWLLLWRPLGDGIFRFRHRHERIRNYTWQRHRR